MKDAIRAFLDDKKVAIVGASPNKDNFGRSLMKELTRKGYEVIPVNPKYENVEGVNCVPTVRELPREVENAILATTPAVTEEVAGQCDGTSIKRVWMIRGAGRGAYSESAREQFRKNRIEVVYGFCPMMFYGEGMHRFHLWIRKTFGKLPEEFKASVE